MSYFEQILLLILGFPKTLYFNFKMFDFKIAMKFPVLISKNVSLRSLKGKVSIESDLIHFGMIKIGFGDIGIFDGFHSRSILKLNGNIIFKGKANLGHGTKLCINGDLVVGPGLVISGETAIVCNKKITIGRNCLISWNVLITDTDFHDVLDTSENVINPDKPIIIGDNVWICCNSLVLKGVDIYNGCIISAASKLNKTVPEKNVIIGSVNNSIVRKNIRWRE